MGPFGDLWRAAVQDAWRLDGCVVLAVEGSRIWVQCAEVFGGCQACGFKVWTGKLLRSRICAVHDSEPRRQTVTKALKPDMTGTRSNYH